MNRNALSVIIVVGILTLSMLGVISFNTIPASGARQLTWSYKETSGQVGTPLTFIILYQDCQTIGDHTQCSAIPDAPGQMHFGVMQPDVDFTTDQNGFAKVTYSYSLPGTFFVDAHVYPLGSPAVMVEIAPAPPPASPTPTVTPASPTPTATLASPTPNNGGGGGDGQTPAVSSATPTAKMNETALALESASGAASSPMGAFWWILGIGAFILLAIFAAVLLLRRREFDEGD